MLDIRFVIAVNKSFTPASCCSSTFDGRSSLRDCCFRVLIRHSFPVLIFYSFSLGAGHLTLTFLKPTEGVILIISMFDTKGNRISLPMTLMPTRRPQYFREGLCLFIALAILAQLFFAWQYCVIDLPSWAHHHDQSANSTLGFGKIYAVSRKASPRRASLLNAASLTGLDITIPVQPVWSDEAVASIRAPVNSAVDRGSAMAWLGHRNVLEKFLKSTDETALIIEDDIDWDTRLRTKQIPQTAYAIRELLDSREGGYYGSSDLWDIIWLGHCGDYFNRSKGSDIPSIKSYNDPAMPNREELHPWTRNFLQEIGAKENQQRLVHQSVRPLCTFAYGITRRAAERVYNDLTVREPQRDTEHPCKAYDVRLLEGCRDEGLKCISVNPELFHHSDLGSEIAQVTEQRASENVESSQEALTESVTTNIRCSARSKKWKEIRKSIDMPDIDAGALMRELAEQSTNCYIDDF